MITVGASSHNGTTDRSDDTVAAFSSRGPSALDFQAKPDIVAPGVGIESLGEAGSTLFNTKPLMRLWGTVPTATEPYLSLSGTSMASPVVSGTIALMLQANPALTPNLVKAILQFTAESRDGYNALTQGAGFLNTRGAVELALSMADGSSLAPLSTSAIPARPDQTPWSNHVIWGNQLITGVQIDAAADAWRTDVMWGTAQALDAAGESDNIVWGTDCGGADCVGVVWGAACGDGECDNIVWGTAQEGDNIVWGTGEEGEGDPSTALGACNIVWGTNVLDDAENIVWGAAAIRRRSRMLVTEPALR